MRASHGAGRHRSALTEPAQSLGGGVMIDLKVPSDRGDGKAAITECRNRRSNSLVRRELPGFPETGLERQPRRGASSFVSCPPFQLGAGAGVPAPRWPRGRLPGHGPERSLDRRRVRRHGQDDREARPLGGTAATAWASARRVRTTPSSPRSRRCSPRSTPTAMHRCPCSDRRRRRSIAAIRTSVSRWGGGRALSPRS